MNLVLFRMEYWWMSLDFLRFQLHKKQTDVKEPQTPKRHGQISTHVLYKETLGQSCSDLNNLACNLSHILHNLLLLHKECINCIHTSFTMNHWGVLFDFSSAEIHFVL